MDVIVCQCGRVIHGNNQAAVVGAMLRHLDREHPELAGATRVEDIVAMIEPAAPDPERELA